MDVFAPDSPTFTVALHLFDGNGDATGLPDTATVEWVSSKPAIVSIERSAGLKALLRSNKAGLATIRAKTTLEDSTIITSEDLNVTVKAARTPTSSKIIIT